MMKYLVLALYVCAASAASVVRSKSGAYTPWSASQAVAQTLLGSSATVAQPIKPLVKTAPYSGVEAEAAILRSDSEVSADGYNYAYETGNGIRAQSSGTLKRVDDVDVLTVQGAFQYSAPDGTPVEFTYIADENGYQPKSDLLPVGPPMPDAIRRAIEYVLAHPPKEEVKKYY